jgi:hypothetical protein
MYILELELPFTIVITTKIVITTFKKVSSNSNSKVVITI